MDMITKNVKKMESGIVEISGVKVVNATKQDLAIFNEGVTIVPKSGFVARVKDIVFEVTPANINLDGKIKYKKHNIVADITTRTILEYFITLHNDVVIIGSPKAAQAYPGMVIGLEKDKKSKQYTLDNLIIY